MGYPMHYNNTQEIWDEMRKLSPKFTGATYEKIDALGGVQWPCYDESMDDKGTVFLHEGGHFATEDGRGNLLSPTMSRLRKKWTMNIQCPSVPFAK